MQTPQIKKQLVLIGGGHANVQVMVAFAQRPLADVSIILVSDRVMAGYSGMLPGWIAGQYNKEQSHIDLARLCKACNVTFIHDRVTSIQTESRMVVCHAQPDIYYDVLSINTGAQPSVLGFIDQANVLPIKPVEDFISNFATQLEAFGSGAKITVVGGGVAATEVTFSLLSRHHELYDLEFQLCHRGDQLLANLNSVARRSLSKELREKGVKIHSKFNLVKVGPNWLEAENGSRVESDITVLCTGGAAPSWLATCDLAKSPEGFVSITPQLQSSSHTGIFAAGDVAEIVGHKLERAGVYAVRQGAVLAENCRRALIGNELRTYHPQKKFLKLISIGNGAAFAAKGWLAVAGHWVFRWKHSIDEKFVGRFNDFRPMVNQRMNTALPVTDEDMRCNGCAAKIENSILRQSLESFGVDKQRQFSDDAAVIEVPAESTLIQSIDFYRAIVDNPYINAQITLNHALNDCYAMGSVPDTVQVMLSIVPASARIQSNMLSQTNSGIKLGLEESGASVIGGHTAESSEPMLGFVVNSFASRNNIWKKSGIQASDDLILTKPLGTGVLFAAHEQALAKGEDVKVGIKSMLQSNHLAAEIMKDFRVSACTDVSGFGLFGHLCEMLPEYDYVVHIEVDSLPVLPGVRALLSDNVRSSLHAANRSESWKINNLENFSEQIVSELLFDPQTSGGLLFSVQHEDSAGALKKLQQSGYQAAVIGRVSKSDEDNLGKLSSLRFL